MDTNFPTQQQFDSFTHFLSSLVSLLPKVALIAITSVISVICIRLAAALIFRLLDMRRLLKQKTVLLELTPQAFTDIDAMATQGLFSELHGLEGVRTYRDKALSRKAVFSPEMVSTRDGGIRYA